MGRVSASKTGGIDMMRSLSDQMKETQCGTHYLDVDDKENLMMRAYNLASDWCPSGSRIDRPELVANIKEATKRIGSYQITNFKQFQSSGALFMVFGVMFHFHNLG